MSTEKGTPGLVNEYRERVPQIWLMSTENGIVVLCCCLFFVSFDLLIHYCF